MSTPPAPTSGAEREAAETSRSPEVSGGTGGGKAGAVERRSTGQKLGKTALLAIVFLWCIIPFLWMFFTSLKTTDAALASPVPWQGPWGWSNYLSVFDQGFGYNLRNSLIVASMTTIICVGIGSLAAYSVARLNLGKKALILTGILTVSLFPPVSLVPPLYEVWRAIGLLNTYPGMWIAYIAFTLPLSIFILTTFFNAIPKDLEEAARVDGATPFQAFYRVILPLAAPGVGSAAILVFSYAWNEYLLASTFAPRDLGAQTVPVAIAGFSGSVQFQEPVGTIMAACVVVTVPMVFFVLILQKRIVAGLTAGGVKG